MNNLPDNPPRSTRESVLRVVVLGAVYALALGFVVALSPSAGLVDTHITGEVGRIAEIPSAQR